MLYRPLCFNKWCRHTLVYTHVYFLYMHTQSQKHYIQSTHNIYSYCCGLPTHFHTDPDTQINMKPAPNTHTNTHSHTQVVFRVKRKGAFGWIGCGWGRSGLVHLISTRLIQTVLTLTQAIHHVISPRWSICVRLCHCMCVLLHIFSCAHVRGYRFGGGAGYICVKERERETETRQREKLYPASQTVSSA